MPFEKKTWKNRQTQHPNRRKLTKVSGDNYDVTRAEGTVTEQGDMFNAQNMNDLETRIESGLNGKFNKDDAADYIVKVGEQPVGNVGWNYIKFNSGRVIMSGYFAEDMQYTSSFLGGYVSPAKTMTYPFTVYSAHGTSSVSSSALAFPIDTSIYESNASIVFCSNYNGNVNTRGSVLIFGYWKRV